VLKKIWNQKQNKVGERGGGWEREERKRYRGKRGERRERHRESER
jgi:hypothetical protein